MPADTRSEISRSTQPVTYASRVDAWLAVSLLLAFGAVIYEGAVLGNYVAWGAGLLLALLLRLVVLPCRYTLMPDHLLVCCGRRRWEIPYGDIKSIMFSFSPVSAPALSLRRVEIRYGREAILVSPRSRTEFMSALQARMRRSQFTQAD